MHHTPLKSAVVGIGGFAGTHHTAWRELGKNGLGKLLATCDPLAEQLTERRARYEFDARGVSIHPDIETMLQACGTQLDLVDVASPIRFHSAHHRLCVERGLACYLEKPPTLDPVELEQMLAIEAGAHWSTLVGFNYIGQPWRQQLKQRLVAGKFGRLRRVAFMGAWRRSQAYYQRNNWAGKLMLGDYLLLDSCCGNAMAHFMHNLLFHAGTDAMMAWAAPVTMEAALYRANPIEGADTVFARGVLDNGVEFTVAATHACRAEVCHTELLECDEAQITVSESGAGVITRRDGSVEQFDTGSELSQPLVRDNLAAYCRYLAGAPFPAATKLIDSRPFVHFNAMLYLAAANTGIRTVPAEIFTKEDETLPTYCIPGIEAQCAQFLRSGNVPTTDWAGQPGRADLSALPRLRDAVAALRLEPSIL
jgi:predicted dehydrogenase